MSLKENVTNYNNIITRYKLNCFFGMFEEVFLSIHIDTNYSVLHNILLLYLNAECFHRKCSSSGVLLQSLKNKVKSFRLRDLLNITIVL